jgi:hypothetical protein
MTRTSPVSKTLAIPIFKFSELSSKAADKARDWWIAATGHEIGTSIHIMYIERLYAAGYPTEQIEFSLNCCQGDGMAFYTGRMRNPKDRERMPYAAVGEKQLRYDVDVGRLLRGRLKPYFSKDKRRRIYQLAKAGVTLDVGINRNSYGHHYSHYNTMSIEVALGDCPEELEKEANELADEILEAIRDDVRDMSKELEKAGYQFWEDATTVEQVSQEMDENEIWFHADGRVVHEDVPVDE